MTENQFISLVPRLRQVALTAAVGAGSDADGAEDVAQDTMIRLWQLLAALERVESPEALTATIARRLALNACRRQSSRLPLADALRQLAASVYAQPDVCLQHHEKPRVARQSDAAPALSTAAGLLHASGRAPQPRRDSPHRGHSPPSRSAPSWREPAKRFMKNWTNVDKAL